LKKVLIIRFSSIGDIVLTTPVVRCLKKQHPELMIHYLTKRSFASLLEHNPYVDKVHSIEKDVKEIQEELKKEQFDSIVDLHNNLRSFQIKWMLKKPSTTFKKLNLRKWLLVRLKINIMPALHVVDRYLQTVEHFGVTNDGKGLDYFISEKDEVDLHTLPTPHQHGYIGFVIGAKHFTKQLPTEKIISICKKLKEPLVLLGGKEDQKRGEEIAAAVGKHIYNACGAYNLNQSASLVKQAKWIISHDTGLMHIAAAFHKRIISVWGNTVPDFGFSPYGAGDNSKIVEVKGLSCRPCSKIGYPQCPRGHFKCMREIDEDAFS
jgi:lipopolysaccharide heptosyltransferase II